MRTDWYRFDQSGFYFKLDGDCLTQGAVRCHIQNRFEWSICSPIPAMIYWQSQRDLFTLAEDDVIDDLNELPTFLSEHESAYLLSVIAE